MNAFFLKIVNMSITASWLVLAVIVVRLLLKKAPKWINVLLWGMVGIRLICPFSFESSFSLIPSAETVPSNIFYTDTPTIHSGVAAFNSVVNPIISESLAPTVGASVNPVQIISTAASLIWIAGIIIMLLYTVISYYKIHNQVKEAVPFKENIWICDRVDTPFILGVIRPRIFLPSFMNEQDMGFVIAHENAHLQRHDHWWKPLGFLLLSIYWFNPVLWIAYILLCRDIELACDEKVIRDLGTEIKKTYSDTLINCSIRHRMITACPLAFGEVGVKERVQSVLHYKKPAFWIIVISVISCCIIAVCFLTNPKTTVDERLAVFIDCEIASHHQSQDSDKYFCGLDWEVIGKETTGNRTTVYMWVLYEEFSNDNNFTVETGAHVLTAITVEKKDGSYNLIEYWEPEDGSKQSDSIKKKVPMYLWSKAMDSQKYIDAQKADLEAMAKKHFGITHAPLSNNNTYQNADMTMLREKYPQYFDLDASNGLDVYVWQMAANSFSFGLLPHAESERDWLSTELLNLKGARTNEMRQILSTYDIDESRIKVIPWQNPFSSYIGEAWIITDDKPITEKQKDYILSIRNMLFGDIIEQPTFDYPVYDPLIFEVDGDIHLTENGTSIDEVQVYHTVDIPIDE